MLVHLLLLILFLFIVFGYTGAKLHLKIKDFDYKFLFWILFIVTILTVIEIIFCIMMWFKYRNKEGSIGPRGFQGLPGPKGDKGKCADGCNVNLITLLFINMIEKNDKKKLIEDEKKKIYKNLNTHKNYINSLNRDSVKKLYNKLLYNYSSITNIEYIYTRDNLNLDYVKGIIPK